MATRALDEKLALELVEQGAGLRPLDRAVLLVSALDGVSPDEAADMGVDERDRRLIDDYVAAFGPTIQFFARCPHCGEPHEGEFDLTALPKSARGEVQAEIGGMVVQVRPPSSRAVAAAALAGEPAALIKACVNPIASEPDADFIEQAEATLASEFPLLNVTFELNCEECQAAFSARFDIGTWLWHELDELAGRTLDAVDRLARAYGWSEGTILALSPARRAAYLAMVAA